ncbi:MAG: hypothetical protein V1861_06815 [Candidatus Micrarchaeota archaeon]
MEYQQKLLLVTAILVAVALYIVFTTAPAPGPESSEEAEALLLKSAGFGKGLTDYTYSYSDMSDGYKTTYSLIKAGDAGFIEIRNPLSTKKVYLLPNDTIFCIQYPVNESCVSVANNSEMGNYISFVQSKFFNDTNILKAESAMGELIKKGYLRVEPEITNKAVGTFACSQVVYIIDYSNVTVDEASRYGIGAQSPKRYSLYRCIDAEGGLAYETGLFYIDKVMEHNKLTTVSAFRMDAPAIAPPANLSGDAISIFRKEREQQVKLATCHTDKTGEEKDKCVSDIAFNLKRKDICELSMSKRDTCLLSIVSLTKDETICQAISDAGMKDSCYIELAGAYKDSTFCAKVADASKVQACQDAATPKPAPQGNETAGNVTGTAGNTTGTVDIEKLLDYVDKEDSDNGNASAENATAGNESEG